jgi:hypothetical protein
MNDERKDDSEAEEEVKENDNSINNNLLNQSNEVREP